MQLRPGTPEDVGMSPERVDRVARLAKTWAEQGIVQGLVVLVARRGCIVLHEAYGRLTPEPDATPLEADAIFPLTSLTKPITATAIMLLVEDGLLGLNRPVAEYIPEFVGEGKEAVAVHHLLTHTSGLRDDDVEVHVARKRLASIDFPPADDTQHPRLHRYLYPAYDAPLAQAPGTEMLYSFYANELLGEIVRRVSGQSLANFAQERIFAPLGMQDSTYIVSETMKPRIVRRPPGAPYASPDSPGMVDAVPPLYAAAYGGLESQELLETPWATGGVHSTAMDMAIFGQMFLSGGSYGDVRILSPTTVAAMTRNQIPGVSARWGNMVFPEAGWGLGWNVLGAKKSLEDGSMFSAKTFSHGGIGLRLMVDPVYEIVAVHFTVVLDRNSNSQTIWCNDLFMNAVSAAIVEV